MNYAQWNAASHVTLSQNQPESVEGLEASVSAGLEWRATLLAVCCRLGVDVDWAVLDRRLASNTSAQMLHLSSQFFSRVLREQEIIRGRFNYSMIAASTSSRYGFLWLFLLRVSRTQWKTQFVFRNIERELEAMLTSFPGDFSKPYPVDWGYIEKMLDDARKLFARDIGTLGRGWDHAPFGRQRERVPWPDGVLKVARERWMRNRASGRVYSTDHQVRAG